MSDTAGLFLLVCVLAMLRGAFAQERWASGPWLGRARCGGR